MGNTNIKIINMRSSFLTNTFVIVGVLGLAAVALAFQNVFPAMFLCICALIGFISRKWALSSLKDVHFEADSDKSRFFPGEDFDIRMKVANQKGIPLVWLDIAVPLEDDSPVIPAKEEDIFLPDGFTKADDELPRCSMLRKRFAFIMPWQELSLNVEMKAVHRGVYHFEKLRVYSGDGFGLTQVGMTAADSDRVFAVYPKLVNVQADMFLRTQWNSTGSRKGYMEEPTLIRGSRDYQPTDSWKRINWRMAARGLPLTVNLPEMILPQSSHFIVDGESFNGEEPDNEGFELMLSILGSVIMRLDAAGLSCGLTLPDALRHESLTFPQDTPVSELMFALAAYERKELVREEGQNQIMKPISRYRSSLVLGACENTGNIYYFTKNIKSADNALVHRLNNAQTVILTMEEAAPEEQAHIHNRIVSMRSLLKA